MDTIHTFTVSFEIQTIRESSVDAWSKEARWNSLLPSNSLLQTTQRRSLRNSAICCFYQLTTVLVDTCKLSISFAGLQNLNRRKHFRIFQIWCFIPTNSQCIK